MLSAIKMEAHPVFPLVPCPMSPFIMSSYLPTYKASLPHTQREQHVLFRLMWSTPCLAFTWPKVVRFGGFHAYCCLYWYTTMPASVARHVSSCVCLANFSPQNMPLSSYIFLFLFSFFHNNFPSNHSGRFQYQMAWRLLAQPPLQQLPLSLLCTHPGFELVAGTQTWGSALGGVRCHAASDLKQTGLLSIFLIFCLSTSHCGV